VARRAAVHRRAITPTTNPRPTPHSLRNPWCCSGEEVDAVDNIFAHTVGHQNADRFAGQTVGEFVVDHPAGIAHALNILSAADTSTWIACTDADSQVPPQWLAHQITCAEGGWDAVVGTVSVTHWPPHTPQLADRYLTLYHAGRPPPGQPPWRHPHVHGANLGVRASAYHSVGGFPSLAVGEDVALVQALERHDHRILRTDTCPVETSSRLHPRADGGFGDHLARLAALERAPR
jgi:hypothetical protein